MEMEGWGREPEEGKRGSGGGRAGTPDVGFRVPGPRLLLAHWLFV